MRRFEDEGRFSRAVELGSQGAWTKWELPSRKLQWTDVWRLEPFRISFLLRSVYDTLPTPVNLFRYGMREDSMCSLCGGRGSLSHILSGCKIALSQGRYRWRHDQVLQSLGHILEQEKSKSRTCSNNKKYINFVKEGCKPKGTKTYRNSLLEKAKSWDLKVDLGCKLKFPPVVDTLLRPDAILWSMDDKKIIMIELTVPWEENCEEAHERKMYKYTELLQTCKDRGWQAWLYPVEVGCRGFPAHSVGKLLSALGMTGRDRKKAIRELGEKAERASCWVWCKRDDKCWKPRE